LYELSDNKLVTVTKMNSLGWGVGCEAWIWGRRLFAWEEDQVKECSEMLHSILLQDCMTNKWVWQLHLSKGYSMGSAFHYWLKIVSLKVNLFTWQFLLSHIPTKGST